MTRRADPTSIDECTDFERAVLRAIPSDRYVDMPTVASAVDRRLSSVSMAIYRLWRGKLVEGRDYEHWRRRDPAPPARG